MRIVNIELDKPRKASNLGREVLGTVAAKLREIYNHESSNQWYRRVGEDMLGYILPLLNYDVKGKTILDLGCGSKNAFDLKDKTHRTFEPWLCRALHELGADVTGVDLHATKSEKFTYLKSDLNAENSLKKIESNSIDLACAFSFFDSPELWEFFGMNAGNRALENLIPQLKRIIRENGVFIFSPTGTQYHKKEYYQKLLEETL